MHRADRNVTIRTNSRSAYSDRRASVTDWPGGGEEHCATAAQESISSVIRITKDIYVQRWVIVLGLLCLTPGCSVLYLAKRTVKYEPREYDITLEEADACEQYANWSKNAWSEYQSQNSGVPTSADYHDGFRNGFVDYCFAGGSGEPPPIPPRRFWRTMYRNVAGDQSFADWSAGFRAGSGAARAGGYRARAVVPSPSSQYYTPMRENPSTWQTNQPIITAPADIGIPADVLAPAETLDDMFDAGELLDTGPELLTPDSRSPAPEMPASETGESFVPDSERDEGPYLKSPLEDVQPDQAATQPRSHFAEPRKMPAPANEGFLDSVQRIEPVRLRYDDFFRLPDESNAPEGDSTNRLGFSPAGGQANDKAAPANKGVDPERAVSVASGPVKKSNSKRSAKNATEWAKHAQTLFQDPDDIPLTHTPYSGSFLEQP